MPATRAVRSNNSTNLLKLIAIAAMLIDHAGAQLFGNNEIMRSIGRLAFPIFAYCIAVGCVYTRSMSKYALRLIIMGVLVQPLYAMTMRGLISFNWAVNWKSGQEIFRYFYLNAGNVNIFFTLTAGVMLIWTVREKNFVSMAFMLLIVFLVESRLDYGWEGVVLMFIFYLFIDRPLVSAILAAVLMLYMGAPRLFTQGEFRFSIQIWALAALPLIYIPFKKNIKINKYVFYVFYPAHLALIYVLKYVFEIPNLF